MCKWIQKHLLDVLYENTKMKILNLYAGIGGNRKLWGDEHEITAVENNFEIAKIYKDFFPNDLVIIGEAHQYLLDHFKEFDFIWSSPPCPTHSRFRFLIQQQEGAPFKYPDMKLYEEIIFLKTWFNGKWVVENVISYYDPLIKPFECAKHYFWSNFIISNKDFGTRLIRRNEDNTKKRQEEWGFHNITGEKRFLQQIINNCVVPKLGLYIFNSAFKEKQETLE